MGVSSKIKGKQALNKSQQYAAYGRRTPFLWLLRRHSKAAAVLSVNFHMVSIETLQKSLARASRDAKELFLDKAQPKSREQYFSRGQLGDHGTGAVYAYFDKDGSALYIGEASRPIKRRMHDQTSPHKRTEWWSKWETVRFLQIQDQTERIVLELLLILALEPPYNSKPGPRDLSTIFEHAS